MTNSISFNNPVNLGINSVTKIDFKQQKSKRRKTETKIDKNKIKNEKNWSFAWEIESRWKKEKFSVLFLEKLKDFWITKNWKDTVKNGENEL